MKRRFILPLLPLGLCATCLDASVVYNLRDARYFPATLSDQNQSGSFTSTTTASFPVSYSSDPGNPAANTFDGLATVNTGPFQLGTDNSVTIGTATTTYNDLGIYSIVESEISDTSVTITGGTGAGYLLPTFHVSGVMSDSNPNADVGDLICAGNSSCLLSSIFGNITSGVHSVDGFYTPAIGSSTSFQFGTPFSFFFFFGSGIQEVNSANPGGTTSADLTLQFDGFQVVDATGQAIPGAQIHSQFADAVNAPEPGALGISLVAAVLGILKRLRFSGGGWVRPAGGR